MFYKNVSASAKTFYEVTFKSGEIKEVPGFINSPKMIRVNGPKAEPKPTETVKVKPAEKKEDKKEEKPAAPATADTNAAVDAPEKVDPSK